MKNVKTLVMLSMVLNAGVAIADVPAKKILVAIYSAPGYVPTQYEYEKDCLIDVYGALKYTYMKPPFKVPTVERNVQLSKRELAEVNQLIEQARADNSKLPPMKRDQDYQTYYGDAPDYGVEFYASMNENNPVDPLYFMGRGEGFDLTMHSNAAKVLEKKLVKFCKMTAEVRMIRKELKQMERD